MLANFDWTHCRRSGCRRKTRNATKLCSPRCAEMAQHARGNTAILPDGAVPVESRLLTFDEVEDHRRLWCRRQASCLDYAERNAWPSYSCTLCPVRDELTEEERKLSWLRMQAAIDEMHEAEESVE